MNSPGTKPSPTHYAPIPTARLTEAYAKARARLLARQHPDGYWTGELSSSSLSTATAVCALSLVDRERFASLIAGGLRWLRDQQNSDGGWGDTVKSFSNISTTMLCRAALTIGHGDVPGEHDQNWRRAESYVERTCGGLDPRTLARAIRARYGQDRTFSVPILSCCALAGLNEWTEAPALPFELACLPSNAYKWINLPVVSYALPALIALGIVRHTRHRSRNPFVRQLRELAKPRALRKLEAIQPVNGGFLEATPLVSFVTMSLAGAGLTAHPVARKGVDFLLASVRPDGSWPIDTNLSTWVTTLSINALAEAGEHFGETGERLRQWLVEQQYRTEHPFTAAAPGGWGWTPLPGAVPDADDTAGALVALRNLGLTAESGVAGQAGAKWLLDLQNSDGGWPTFCRGWGYLPFDRSSADITAHALRALQSLPVGTYSDRIERAIQSGMQFLDRSQRPDGSWVPLWFGNQSAPDDENPTYGTARVLAAYHDLNRQETVIARRGYQWLITSQNADGGWGGAPGLPSSVEETALAVEALLGCPQTAGSVRLPESLALGLRWLVERVEDDSFTSPSPIGFYFAKLWYFEQLYPVVFTVGALGRALRLSTEQVDHGSTSFSI
ncbi:MAG TPA: prenyltransferase/squalene oxidase repeat-containing protein [Blastocatellia bacterium]|nr:prenyltransferase/squalene oxidase repeat-containing protein [Blastocatellia bacterium]